MLRNESAARTFLGADNRVGKRISLGPVVKDAEVIGIVGDIRPMPDSAPPPTTYVPSTQSDLRGVVFVRSRRDVATIGDELRRAVHRVSPQVLVSDMQTMT